MTGYGFAVRVAPLLVAVLLLGPVVAGLVGSLLPALGYGVAGAGAPPTLAAFTALAATPGFARSTMLALGTGLAAAALSFLLAVLAVAAALRGQTLARLSRLSGPLVAVPHAAAAFGLAALIQPSGLIARLISPELTGWTQPPDALIVNDPLGLTLTAALVAKEMPFLALLLVAALGQVDAARVALVARALGHGPIGAMLHAVMPRVYPQVRLGVFAVIVYGVSTVDMAMILGPTTPPTLAVLTLRFASDPTFEARAVGAAGALALLAVAIVAILVWVAGERLVAALARRWALAGPPPRPSSATAARLAGALASVLPAATVLAGLATLALWSIAGPWRFPDALPMSVNLMPWREGGGRLLAPLAETLAIGLASAVIATALVLLSLENEARREAPASRAGIALLYLPLLVPQFAFLNGLTVYSIVLGVDGSRLAVLVAHLVFVIPYVYLALVGPWRAVDARLSLVAATLGASPGRRFLAVRLPLMVGPILVALSLGFAVSVAQYLPTLLIGAGRIATVTTEAVALAAGQDRRLIGVAALVQTGVTGAAFLVAGLVLAVATRNRRGLQAGGAA